MIKSKSLQKLFGYLKYLIFLFSKIPFATEAVTATIECPHDEADQGKWQELDKSDAANYAWKDATITIECIPGGDMF